MGVIAATMLHIVPGIPPVVPRRYCQGALEGLIAAALDKGASERYAAELQAQLGEAPPFPPPASIGRSHAVPLTRQCALAC